MRWIVLSFVISMMISPLHATEPVFTQVETQQPFEAYITKLKGSIAAHHMGIVSEACATCGAKSIGVTIAGNQVIMIFNPHFAVRMLKASIPAGIEAPLRLYITEKRDGMAVLTYVKPSHIFEPYGVKELDEMTKELDQIIAEIVKDTL